MYKIKIFATQRIDKSSKLIKNEIFEPVRCGAVFDKSESTITGDNTGDNISNKRMSYCELTTQYWAWKNVDADYYGFCHYRRYFSFYEKEFPYDGWGNVVMDKINDDVYEKLCIDPKNIYSKVSEYDVILPSKVNLSPLGFKNVREQFKSVYYLKEKDIDITLDIIADLYPEFHQTAIDYFDGHFTWFCNMFIMKRQLFYDYSKWLFDILFEFEKRVDMSNYSENSLRTPGHLGERLLGVYITHLIKAGSLKTQELQLVVFKNTDTDPNIIEPFKEEANIPVVMACSDYYAPYASVLIQSIIDYSNINFNYDIIVLEREIKESTRKLMLRLIEGMENFSLRFINVEIDEYKLNVTHYFSIETYFRLILPDVLAKYDKVIYLDSDMLVRRDLADLYREEVEGYLLAATRDFNGIAMINGADARYRKYCYRELKLQDPYQYFQAGTLIINLYEFRKNYTVEDILKYAQSMHFEYLDQDILNNLCQGKVKFLSNKWDIIADCEHCLSNILRAHAPREIFEEYISIYDDAYIVHYAGPTKPWHSPFLELAGIYWETAKRTPFYEMLIYRMSSEDAMRILNYHLSTHNHSFTRKRYSILRKLSDIIIPRGTYRRELIKRVLFKLIRKPYIRANY